MRAGPRRRGALALVAALALGACGGDDGESGGAAEPVGQELAGSVAPLAQCRDWEGGTRDERVATIAELKRQINLEDSAKKTPELSDNAAYRILDTTCSKPFAATFRLYKIYARATSFAPFAEG